MSPLARALEERFDEVCRAEIARMTRKTRGLTPERTRRVAGDDLSGRGRDRDPRLGGSGAPGRLHFAPVLAQLFDFKEAHESCDGGTQQRS
jgi:hypothetical protein